MNYPTRHAVGMDSDGAVAPISQTQSRQALPNAEVCGNLGRRSVRNLKA